LLYFKPRLLHPIQHRSREAQVDLSWIRAREVLVESRTQLIDGRLQPLHRFPDPGDRGVTISELFDRLQLAERREAREAVANFDTTGLVGPYRSRDSHTEICERHA
jgi:hypothetical protein